MHRQRWCPAGRVKTMLSNITAGTLKGLFPRFQLASFLRRHYPDQVLGYDLSLCAAIAQFWHPLIEICREVSVNWCGNKIICVFFAMIQLLTHKLSVKVIPTERSDEESRKLQTVSSFTTFRMNTSVGDGVICHRLFCSTAPFPLR